MIKAFLTATVSNIVLMFPVGLLYFLVEDYLNDNLSGRGVFYLVGSILCLVLIAVTTYIQYNCTFLATYVESGVRRITLAEKLRKIPLSFFGKKDLSDLTSTIMADCATIETASSHLFRNFLEPVYPRQLLLSAYFSLTGGWHWLRCGCFRYHSSLC